MTVIMYNKTRPLLHLDMEGTTVTKIKGYVKENKKYLPICFQNGITLESLNEWISKRLMSRSREGLEDALREFPNFEQYGCMFSLSDQYWFKSSKYQTWESLNFFTNEYTEDIGKIFFSPWEVNPDHVGSVSPDLSTNGVLRKAWLRENGKNYLYKAGSERHHQQPISEVLATLFSKKLDFLPFVEYELDIYGLKLCSKCENFIDENTEFVPASHIYNLKRRLKGVSIYNHFLNLCDEFGIVGVKEYLDKMIAADKIIGNDDRHFGNFGFIRDVETATIVGFAPLFDSGSSFYGVHDGEKKAKLFEDESYEAIKSVMRSHDLNSALDCQQMFDLIDKYPEISWQKKVEMKERIKDTVKNIKKVTDSITLELKNEEMETPSLD